MHRYSELLNLGWAELQRELEKSSIELQELRMGNRMKQLKETHKIRIAQRYIAQIKTALKHVPPEAKAAPAAEKTDVSAPKKKKTPAKKTVSKPAEPAKKTTKTKKQKE